MDIKLNKSLQKKLDSFLELKDEKLSELLKRLELETFTYSKEEINYVEGKYKNDNSLIEYINIYTGEAVIKTKGGFWSIGKFKNDEAYELPIILGKGGKEDSPRICPDVWLYYIDKNDLGKPLGDFIYSL